MNNYKKIYKFKCFYLTFFEFSYIIIVIWVFLPVMIIHFERIPLFVAVNRDVWRK